MSKEYIALSNSFAQYVTKFNTLVNKVGDLANLTTGPSADSDLVQAINLVFTTDSGIQSSITALEQADSNILVSISALTDLDSADVLSMVDSAGYITLSSVGITSRKQFVTTDSDQTINSEKTFTKNILVEKAFPRLILTNTNLPSGISKWDITSHTNGFLIRPLDDSNVAVDDAYRISRDSTGATKHLWQLQAVNELLLDSVGLNLTNSGRYREDSIDISPIGTHTMSIPGVAFKSTKVLGATYVDSDFLNSGFDFGPDSNRKIQFGVLMPKSWDEGNLTAEINWRAADSVGTGDVRWGIRVKSITDGDSTGILFGSYRYKTDTYLGTDVIHLTDTITSIVPGGSFSTTENEYLLIEIIRSGTAGGDTYNFDARFLGARISLQTNAANDD